MARRLEVVIQANKLADIKADIRATADSSERWQKLVEYFGDARDESIFAKLVLNPDGSGNVVARGMSAWVSDLVYQFLKDARNELDPSLRPYFTARAPLEGDDHFWVWAATLPTPLYGQASDIEAPIA